MPFSPASPGRDLGSIFQAGFCGNSTIQQGTREEIRHSMEGEMMTLLTSMQTELMRVVSRQEDMMVEVSTLIRGQEALRANVDELKVAAQYIPFQQLYSMTPRTSTPGPTRFEEPLASIPTGRPSQSVESMLFRGVGSDRGTVSGPSSADETPYRLMVQTSGRLNIAAQSSLASRGSRGRVSGESPSNVVGRVGSIRTSDAGVLSDDSQDELDVSKVKSMGCMALHETWNLHQTFQKRMFHPSFDIFARSAHSDHHLGLRQGNYFSSLGALRGGDQVIPASPSSSATLGRHSKQKCKFLQQFVMSPSSNFLMCWSVIELTLLTYDFLYVPALVFDLPQDTFTTMVQWIALFFWSMDLPISFFKGYITERGELEMKLSRVVRKYVRSGLPLDISLLSVEYTTFALILSLPDGRAARATRFLRMLRYTKSLKIGKMRRLIRRILARVKSPAKLTIFSTFGRLMCLLGLCHIGACAWFQVSKSYNNEDGLYRYVQSESQFRQYMQCLQMCMSTMGFGHVDIFPVTLGELICAVLFGTASMVGLTLWVGDVITSMIWLQDLNRADREREMRMRDFLRDHDVSWNLRNRVWALCSDGKGSHVVREEEVELFKKLPENMMQELRAEVFVPVLTNHPFFGVYSVSLTADRHAMYNLIKKEAMGYVQMELDGEVFSERETAEYMYFVVTGTIAYRWKETIQVHEKEWLAEAALWLKWIHVGQAMATRTVDMVQLDASMFREIMKYDLPEAHRYAFKFGKNALRLGSAMNDVVPMYEDVMAMAEDVFAAVRVFDISRCRPEINKNGKTEWYPADDRTWQEIWQSAWNESNMISSSALITTMMSEMKSDVILWYQTLFPQSFHDHNKYFPWTSEPEQAAYDKRIMFLKRLFLCFALCGVSYSDVDNGFNRSSWPYPLASVLSHGGRVLMHLNKVPPKELLNFLLFGKKDGWSWDRQGVPGPLYARHAASHGVVVDAATSQLQEVKLKGTAALNRSRHMGMDIPVGGLSNPSPKYTANNKLLVGPAGTPYYLVGREAAIQKEFQHGHLYSRWDDFGPKPMWRLGVTGSSAPAAELAQDPYCTLRVQFLINLARKKEVEHTQAEEWQPLRDLSEVQGFKLELINGGAEALSKETDRLSRLYHYIVDTKELVLERTPTSARLRARGLLVYLTVESEDDTLFTHASAFNADIPDTASVRSGLVKSRVINENQKVMDPRVVSFVCNQTESWFAALATGLKSKLQLSDSGVEKIFQGLSEQAVLSETPAPPTLCHHHMDACGIELPLMYDALYLRSRISVRDKQILESAAGDKVLRTEESMDLDGWPALTVRGRSSGDESSVTTKGPVIREWKWISKQAAGVEGVLGVAPPAGSPVTSLDLAKELANSASILLGVENSAPLKEDLWGQSHGVDAKSKPVSAFGKRKWRDYRKGGQEAPAELGGVHVCVTEENFARMQELDESLPLITPSSLLLASEADRQSEQELFQRVLQSSDREMDAVMKDYALTYNKRNSINRRDEVMVMPSINHLLCRLQPPVGSDTQAGGSPDRASPDASQSPPASPSGTRRSPR